MNRFYVQKFKKVLIGFFAAIALFALAAGALFLGPNPADGGAQLVAHAEAYKPYAERDAEEEVDADHGAVGSAAVKFSVVTSTDPFKVKAYYFDDVAEGWEFWLSTLDSSSAYPAEMRLLKETTLSAPLSTTVGLEKHVLIDLNGQTLKNETAETANGRVLSLSGGYVTIADSNADGSGTLTSTNSAAVYVNTNSDATLTFAGGTVTGSKGAIDSASNAAAKVYIEGGKITGNTDTKAAVCVNGNVQLFMTGGEISGNTDTSTKGAGVCVNGSNAAFTMSGGRIYQNKVESGNGGGVFVSGGKFTMKNGDGEKPVIGADDEEQGNVARQGGGIFVENGGTLLLEGGEIKGNVAKGTGTDDAWGGGICVGGNSSPGTIITAAGEDGVVISSNKAVQETTPQNARGGGIYIGADSGSPSAELRGGKVIKNSAHTGGGVYVNRYGGVNVKFLGIVIGGKEGDGNVATAEVASTAYNYGGGGIYTEGSNVEISGGEISYNKAENALGGGVMAAGVRFTVSGGKISHNTAERGGGVSVGLTSDSNGSVYLTMTGGEISYNVAKNAGGGLYGFHGGVELDGGKITYNSVSEGNPAEATSGNGGGICIAIRSYTNYRLALRTGEISHNSAANGYGGGIYVPTAMSNSVSASFYAPKEAGTLTVSNNVARAGGALYVAGNAFFLSNANSADDAGDWLTFEKNTATNGDGGAIYASGVTFQTANARRYAVTFKDNVASLGGGAIYSGTSAIVQQNATVTFTGNEAKGGDGGAWYAKTSLAVSGVVNFGTEEKGNTAAGNGGGLFSASTANSSSLTLSDSGASGKATFKKNKATGDGGGLYASGLVAVPASASLTVEENVAGGKGGGVYAGGNYFSSASVDNVLTVRNNTSEGEGAGVYLTENASFTIAGHVIVENNKRGGKNSNVYLETRQTLNYSTGNADSHNNFGLAYVYDKLQSDSRIGLDFVPNETYNPNHYVIAYRSSFALDQLTLLHAYFFADDESYRCIHPDLTSGNRVIALSKEHEFPAPNYIWDTAERENATVRVEQSCLLGCGKTYDRPLETDDYGYPGSGDDLKPYSATYDAEGSAAPACDAAGYELYKATVKIFDAAANAEKTVEIEYRKEIAALGHKWEWDAGRHSLHCAQCETEDASELGEAALVDKREAEEVVTVYRTFAEAWTAASQINATAEQLTVFLLKDVVLLAASKLEEAYDYVTLDLNGKRMTGSGGIDLFDVSGGATFVLDDTSEGGNGMLASGNNGVYVQSGSTFLLKRGIVSGMTIGVRLDGNAANVFTMTGGSVTNNRGSQGSGVFMENGTFTLQGGVISKNSFDSNPTGSSDYQYGGGGVRVANGTFLMEGGEISGNFSYKNGGGVNIYGVAKVTISGGKISGNTAHRNGAGICNYNGTLIVMGETVIENNELIPTASQTQGVLTDNAANGGGLNIVGGTVTIRGNVQIKGNKAYQGGGIYKSGGTLTIEGVAIEGNTAYQGGGYYEQGNSPAVWASGENLITGNHAVKRETSLGDGGGLYSASSGAELRFLTVKGNTAEGKGGGIYLNAQYRLYDGTLVENNTAESDGGGIYAATTSNLYGGTIKGNSSGASGGGLFVNTPLSQIYGPVLFEGNKAKSGGGLYVQGAFSFIAAYAVSPDSPFEFKQNAAEIEGGGLYVTGAATLCVPSIDANFAVVFDGNKAAQGGGLCAGGDITIGSDSAAYKVNAEFKNNTATQNGGAICAKSNLKIYASNQADVVFTATGNQAAGDGGAIYVTNNLENRGTLAITENKAGTVSGTGKGGGVFVGKLVKLRGFVTVRDNTADCGGKSNAPSDFYLNCASFVGSGASDYQKENNVIYVDGRLDVGSKIGIYLVPTETNGEHKDVFLYCSDTTFLSEDVARSIFFSDIVLNGGEGQECLYKDSANLYYMTKHAYPEAPEFDWDDDHAHVRATLDCERCRLASARLTGEGTIEGGEIVASSVTGDCTTDTVSTFTVTLTLGAGIYRKEYAEAQRVVTPAEGHKWRFVAAEHTVKCEVCEFVASEDPATLAVVAVAFGEETTVFPSFSQEAWNKALGYPSSADELVTVYILKNGITADVDVFYIEGSKHICLDLNGCSVKGHKNTTKIFSVRGASAQFVLTDTSEGKDGNLFESGGIELANTALNSSILFKGGTIRGTGGSNYAVTVAMGTFEMFDGAFVTDNAAGGVSVTEGNAKFIMHGGTIARNNVSGSGAGVSIAAGDFTLEGGTISGNTAGSNGGGVYVGKSVSAFEMKGGEISGNVATSQGGGVYCYGTFVLDGGKIRENRASQGAGVYIYSDNSATGHTNRFLAGEISGNVATSQGGGLYLNRYGSTNITSEFGGGAGEMRIENNRVETPAETLKTSLDTYGGAGIFVQAQRVVVRSNTFIDGNGTNCSGGGIYVGGSSNNNAVMIEGGEIKNNTAARSGGGSLVTGRYAVQIGGANSNFTLEKGTIGSSAETAADNFTNGILGTGTLDGSTVTIRGGTIRNCQGYGINLSGKVTVVLTGGEIYGNKGGVSLSNGVALEAKGVKIRNNTVVGGNSNGGGIAMSGAGNLTIGEGTEIYSNQATNGGGVYVSNIAKFAFEGGTIRGNAATSNGGGIYVGGSVTADFDGGTLTGNGAQSGGGVYLSGSVSFSLIGGVIGGENEGQGNKAKNNGGGIFATGRASVYISGGEVKYNAALNQDSKTGNSTGNGGGIYADGGAQIKVSSGKIAYNTAKLSGGGIYASGGSTAVLFVNDTSSEGAELSHNVAQAAPVNNVTNLGGGAVYVIDASVTLNGFGYSFVENVSNAEGGAIMVYGSSSSLTAKGNNCSFAFRKNKANKGSAGSGAGGAIYASTAFNVETATVTLTFEENEAAGQGGAIYAANLNVTGWLVLERNAAGTDGGGIYVKTRLTFTGAANVTARENTARKAGGGAYVKALSLAGNAVNVTLSDNEAGTDGGGLYLEKDFVYDPEGIESEDPAQTGRAHFAVTGNTAGTEEGGNGGGIYFASVGALDVKANFDVKGNVAQNEKSASSAEKGNGGGIYTQSSDLSLYGVVLISGNTAQQSGGGIYSGSTALSLPGKITISSNTASGHGGGIYASVGTIDQTGADAELTVTGNVATSGNGDGIYSAGNVTVETKLTVTENKAGAQGGGVLCKAQFSVKGLIVIKGNTHETAVSDDVYVQTLDKSKERNGLIVVAGELTVGSQIYFFYMPDSSDAHDGLFMLADPGANIDEANLKTFFYSDRDDLNCTYFDSDKSGGKIKKEHTYQYEGGAKNWMWTTDNSATLTMTCVHCARKDTYTKEATVLDSTPPNCTAEGLVTYKVSIELGGQTFEDTNKVTVPALGHEWKWVEGELVCDRCSQNATSFGFVVALQPVRFGVVDAKTYTLFAIFSEAWKEALQAEGEVRLTIFADTSVSENLEFDGTAAATHIALDLNGHKLSNTLETREHVFLVRGGKTFTVMDGRTGGELAAMVYGVSVEGGTFNLESGAIVGKDDKTLNGVRVMGADGNEGIFNMKGGKISGVKVSSADIRDLAAGVLVQAGGVFNLSGGEISGNETTRYGAGVLVQGGAEGLAAGKFTMTAGTISGNVAEGDGGGAYVAEGAKFTLSGGRIEGNSAGGNGGGVYFAAQGGLGVFGEPVVQNNTRGAGKTEPSDVYVPVNVRIEIENDLGEGAKIAVYMGAADAATYDYGFVQLNGRVEDLLVLKERFPSDREEFDCWSIDGALGHLRKHLFSKETVDGKPNPAWDWTLDETGYTGVTATFVCDHCKEKTEPQAAEFHKSTIVEGDCTTDRREQVSAELSFDGGTFKAEPQTFTIPAPGHAWAVRVSPDDPSVAEIYCTVETCEMHDYGLGGTVKLSAESCTYDAAEHRATIIEALSGAGAIEAIGWTEIAYRYGKTEDLSSGTDPENFRNVGFYRATVTVSSDKRGEPAEISVLFRIEARRLSIVGGITAETKKYDGTHDATIDVSKAVFDDKVSGDDVTIRYASATFSDKYVGSHKQVTVTGIALSGSSAENYVLDKDEYVFESEANIEKLDLTIAGGITAENKEYDGNTSVAVNVAFVEFDGLIADDELSPPVITGYTAAFDGADVGKHVVKIKDVVLSGDCAVNYPS